MEDVVETLGVVENTIGTITSLPIWNNRTYRKHDACVVVSVVLSIFFEMPIMICGVYLMRYKGTIDWDQQFFELMFQIWYIVNLMIQITFGFADKVYYWKCWGVVFVAPLSYVIACLPYAFVIIPMSGWHWFETLSGYYNNSQNFIHGTFNSTDTHNMLEFLIVSGFVGQWIWSIILANIPLIAAVKFLLYIKHKYGRVEPEDI
ncbi:uncharacterized protein LOC114574509 [Exaiptasia diaphana]|uniref:Uncharacterized protein n=1 Tax=Exaiptasia diaphana TaxID=2652724 RepID=A0A913YDN0_EXADI|nr:uncharacterized protein LOC114574509 [Exaiptasia diaphana]KXJ18036.1 hypothetical protein AC249_AIPGENE21447 [Exaiptasia diaphana]